MKKTTENPTPEHDLTRVLKLLWQAAEGGSVSAQKALYAHYANAEQAERPEDDYSAIYGDNVTPLHGREAS